MSERIWLDEWAVLTLKHNGIIERRETCDLCWLLVK